MKKKNIILLMVLVVASLGQAHYNDVVVSQLLTQPELSSDDLTKLSDSLNEFNLEDQTDFKKLLKALKPFEFGQAVVHLYVSCRNKLMITECIQECVESAKFDIGWLVPCRKICDWLTEAQKQAKTELCERYDLKELASLLSEVDYKVIYVNQETPDTSLQPQNPLKAQAELAMSFIFLTHDLNTYALGEEKGFNQWQCSDSITKLVKTFKSSHSMLCFLRDIIMVLHPENPITPFISLLSTQIQTSADRRMTLKDIIAPVVEPLMERRGQSTDQVILSHAMMCAQYCLIMPHNMFNADMYASIWFRLALNSDESWQRVAVEFMQLPRFIRLQEVIMRLGYCVGIDSKRLDEGDMSFCNPKTRTLYFWDNGGFGIKQY